MHTRYAKQYIRTIRGDNKDPLTVYLKQLGVPNEPAVTSPDSTTVFSFGIVAPETSVCRNDLTAIEQLEFWKLIQLNWCEHKPSVTIYVEEDEWFATGAWVYENFDIVSGISFLPKSDHVYKQAPLQDCDLETAQSLHIDSIDWDGLTAIELEDATTSAREYACTSGACDIM
jgi:ribonucleoside-diphosphate reductase alpha chain